MLKLKKLVKCMNSRIIRYLCDVFLLPSQHGLRGQNECHLSMFVLGNISTAIGRRKHINIPHGLLFSLLGVELFSDSIISHSFAVYVAGVSILSFLFFVGRYNQHHGTAHFILHPRNIHHVFRRLRLHNMIYYKTI